MLTADPAKGLGVLGKRLTDTGGSLEPCTSGHLAIISKTPGKRFLFSPGANCAGQLLLLSLGEGSRRLQVQTSHPLDLEGSNLIELSGAGAAALLVAIPAGEERCCWRVMCGVGCELRRA